MGVDVNMVRSPSVIYFEPTATEYPLGQRLRSQYQAIPQVPIRHYSEIFHRPKQHFQLQKRAPALIVAVADKKRVYQSNERVESFGIQPLYYSDQLRNCPFNCSYCFLQGMHASGHWLVFVNEEDYQNDVRQILAREHQCWLSISYLSDLLGFEDEIPLCHNWIAMAAQEPSLTVEIRTKSNNIRPLLACQALPNVVVVWSLSPTAGAQRYEAGTASPLNRIRAAKLLQQRGWRIALCFDPMVLLPHWKNEYELLLAQTFSILSPDSIDRVSFGTFRMHPAFLKQLRVVQPQSDIVHWHYPTRHNMAAPPPETIQSAASVMRAMLRKFIPAYRIHFVHG